MVSAITLFTDSCFQSIIHCSPVASCSKDNTRLRYIIRCIILCIKSQTEILSECYTTTKNHIAMMDRIFLLVSEISVNTSS